MQNPTLHCKCQARGTVCQLFLSLALSAEHSEIDVAHLSYKYAKIYIFPDIFISFHISSYNHHSPGLEKQCCSGETLIPRADKTC